MKRELVTVISEAWKEMQDLIAVQAPAAWPDVMRRMQTLAQTCATTGLEEIRRAFGHGWEEGHARGYTDGWDARDEQAYGELMAKDGEINVLKANLCAAKIRLQRYESADADVITSGD